MSSDDPVDASELADHAAVKVSWRDSDDGWTAAVVATDGDGFVRVTLEAGVEFDLEVTDDRRCVGYFSEVGERRPCPEFHELDSGSRCEGCRRRDVFSGYVEGREPAEVDPDVEFCVYLARCGSGVKVGVTRADKLERRWVEQGADEAAVLRSGLDSREALDLESELSNRYSIPERIRKPAKVEEGDVDLGEVVRSRGIELEDDAVDVSGSTVYPALSCTGLARSGRFSGRVDAVKGQIVSFDSGLCVAVSSGRVLRPAEQSGLGDF